MARKKPMKILSVLIVLVTLLFAISVCTAQTVQTKRDTLFLHIITSTNSEEDHYDTVYCKIYHKSTLLATVGLQSNINGTGLGTWIGEYISSNFPFGNSWVKYLAVVDGITIPLDWDVSILDTIAFIGAAAGLTAAEIADTIRGILSGEGLDTLDLYVFDDDNNAVEGVTITVYNFAKTAKAVRSKVTDVNGKAQVWLNADQYQVLVACVGVTQTEWDTVTVVSGGSRDTIWVESFDPGSPPSGDLCLVYGWVYDINDNPISGVTVTAKIDSMPLHYGTKLISPYTKTDTTDTNGYWDMAIYPNSLLTPTTTKYQFSIFNVDGTVLEIETTVPDSANWELTW